ncbi:hypothetical protein D3C81_1987420 [compost metagenome]
MHTLGNDRIDHGYVHRPNAERNDALIDADHVSRHTDTPVRICPQRIQKVI